MKKILLLLFVFFPFHVHGSDVRFEDGKVVFPKYRFSGQPIYTDEEKAVIDDRHSVFYSTTTRPRAINTSQWKVQISTCALGFSSKEDFEKSLRKKGLRKKIVELKAEYQAAQEVDAKDVGDLRDRISMLREIYKGLGE